MIGQAEGTRQPMRVVGRLISVWREVILTLYGSTGPTLSRLSMKSDRTTSSDGKS